MERSYVVNYNCSNKASIEVPGNLKKAQEVADKNAECTGKDITIMLKERVAATRRWNEGSYEKSGMKAKKPIIFGEIGFYSDWIS